MYESKDEEGELNMTHKYDTCAIDCSFYDVCYGKLAYCPKRIVEKHISDLSEREQYVVNMRCGFNDNQQHSFAEIGRNLGLSGARVSQIYKQAICHRYKDYLGIPEHIVMCGKQNENYAIYYSGVFASDLKATVSSSELYHTLKSYEHIDINGNSVPFFAVATSDMDKATEDLSISITEWKISSSLKDVLEKGNVTCVADVLCKPFQCLFFDIVKLDYNLLLELFASINEFKNGYEIIGLHLYPNIHSFNDDELRNELKRYIKRYIYDGYRRLETDNDYEEKLKNRLENMRLAKAISELWYIDSTKGVNCACIDFWHQISSNIFVMSYTMIKSFKYFNDSIIQDVFKQPAYELLDELDIGELDLNVRLFTSLKRAGIDSWMDFIKCSDDLKHIRNLGKTGIDELLNKKRILEKIIQVT